MSIQSPAAAPPRKKTFIIIPSIQTLKADSLGTHLHNSFESISVISVMRTILFIFISYLIG